MESQGCQQYYNLYANGSFSHEEEQYTLNPHKRQGTTSSGLVSSLKSERNLFSRLFVASQFRDGNLNYYFSHKNQSCPPSLSARGKLKLGTTSDIVRCLEDAAEKQDDIAPSIDVVMLDGPVMLCVLKPAASGTLREYACPWIRRRLEPNKAVPKNYENCSESTRTRQCCSHCWAYKLSHCQLTSKSSVL